MPNVLFISKCIGYNIFQVRDSCIVLIEHKWPLKWKNKYIWKEKNKGMFKFSCWIQKCKYWHWLQSQQTFDFAWAIFLNCSLIRREVHTLWGRLFKFLSQVQNPVNIDTLQYVIYNGILAKENLPFRIKRTRGTNTNWTCQQAPQLKGRKKDMGYWYSFLVIVWPLMRMPFMTVDIKGQDLPAYETIPQCLQRSTSFLINELVI